MAEGKQESWAKLPYWIHQKGLGFASRVVYAVLLDEARESGTVTMGMRRLARVLETESSTVARAISELESRALITIVRGKKGISNTYRLEPRPQSTVRETPTVDPKRPYAKRTRRPYAKRLRGVGETPTEPYAKRPHKTRETSSRQDRPAGKPRRARCEVWDTLCELFKDVVDPVADKKRIGLVRKKLIAKGATAAEMKIRAARYQATWPDMEFTPEALNKHWKRFENENTGTSRPGDAEGNPGGYGGVKPFRARPCQRVLPGCGLPPEIQKPVAEGATEAE